MKDMPDFCIRGIFKSSLITPEGDILADVFIPDDRTKKDREDGGSEVSINWEDDEEAVKFTLKKYPNGVVRLAKTEIDRVNMAERANNDLSYERTPKADNIYHGNIVFHNHLRPAKIREIAAVLATFCSSVILE